MAKKLWFKVMIFLLILIVGLGISRIEVVKESNTGVRYIKNIPKLVADGWYFNFISEKVKVYPIQNNLELKYEKASGMIVTVLETTTIIDNKLIRYELKYWMYEEIKQELEIKYGRGMDVGIMMSNVKSAIRASFIKHNNDKETSRIASKARFNMRYLPLHPEATNIHSLKILKVIKL